jgi:hypothetical protein
LTPKKPFEDGNNPNNKNSNETTSFTSPSLIKKTSSLPSSVDFLSNNRRKYLL